MSFTSDIGLSSTSASGPPPATASAAIPATENSPVSSEASDGVSLGLTDVSEAPDLQRLPGTYNRQAEYTPVERTSPERASSPPPQLAAVQTRAGESEAAATESADSPAELARMTEPDETEAALAEAAEKARRNDQPTVREKIEEVVKEAAEAVAPHDIRATELHGAAANSVPETTSPEQKLEMAREMRTEAMARMNPTQGDREVVAAATQLAVQAKTQLQAQELGPTPAEQNSPQLVREKVQAALAKASAAAETSASEDFEAIHQQYADQAAAVLQDLDVATDSKPMTMDFYGKEVMRDVLLGTGAASSDVENLDPAVRDAIEGVVNDEETSYAEDLLLGKSHVFSDQIFVQYS